MASKNRKFLLFGIAFFGAVGFVGPLLFTLFSIFTGVEKAPAPRTPTAENQADPARTRQEIAGYEKILQREPNNVTALSSLATLYLQQFQFDRAIPLVARLADQQPDNPRIRLQLAELYQVSGKPAQAQAQYLKAIPVYEKLASQQPDNLSERLQLAQIYQLAGQPDKAEKAYDQVLAKDKKRFEALIGKGDLRLKAGNKTAAQALYSQAEQAAPAEEKPRVQEYVKSRLNPPKPPVAPKPQPK
ncbi:tetratricopeptide repeat protein [Gloeobacter kilaueensis]|uniref:Tetratricopeptide repeat protein n=1 Tax=Gloeobacter kilaueensis (strain ATCC BAA-2537 / CCAP 1431/1 / ULC 316 / JS1) TaxID=1183438 RepID=U5QBJ9_GLOK1|nr:tetratricopeptide repeat protein [Gloeobacter kilaueensis]AGY56272.1 tetratricopeptide repeat protein [Gloeobacter kilaueensis JS1]